MGSIIKGFMNISYTWTLKKKSTEEDLVKYFLEKSHIALAGTFRYRQARQWIDEGPKGKL